MTALNIHFAATGSWGVLGRALSRSLARLMPVALIEPPLDADDMDGDFAAFARGLPAPDPSAPTLNLGDWRRSAELPGRRVASFIGWETTRIPRERARAMRALEEIWVPTEWQRRVFENNDIDPARIRVAGLGHDPEVFFPAARTRAPGAVFRFLFVGKWETRKGVDVLLRAFTREFCSGEPVELVLAAHNPFLPGFSADNAIAGELTRLGAPDARVVSAPPSDEAGLAELYRSADAFVLPSRGEGWGLPLLEAMACGLPCIATRHGGPTEFATDDTVFFLRRGLWLGRVNDPVFYKPGEDWGRWANPSEAHLRRLMRGIVDDPRAARAKGEAAAAHARSRWTWDHAARRMAALINGAR